MAPAFAADATGLPIYQIDKIAGRGCDPANQTGGDGALELPDYGAEPGR